MKFIETRDVRQWFEETGDLTTALRGIGRSALDGHHLEDTLGLPLHVQFALTQLAEDGKVPSVEALSSIPYYSLCKGFFVPISGMSQDRAAQLFGVALPSPPDSAAREALLGKLIASDLGLTLDQKMACILGDPFMGERGGMQRDSLVRLLMSIDFRGRRAIHDRLTQVGDIAHVYAESRPNLRSDPPLSATEVLVTLQYLGRAGRNLRMDLMRSLLARMGKMEAYFLCKLVMRKAGFGFDYQGPMLSKALAESFGAELEPVAHAVALTDFFHVSRILAKKGPDGLRDIQLQPLVAVRPALASGTVEAVKEYPTWVERKYDGIRLMLHKSTDSRGSVLCAAYTRGRRDWMELVTGLRQTIQMIPGSGVIVDGELYGTVADMDGARPASVYEVYSRLQGDPRRPVNLKFAAFDLIYLNGQDLTKLPLGERRRRLQMLLGPLAGMPLPVPIDVAEGQLAQSKEDVNRLYQHFRAQGYEGAVTKNLDGTYHLASRDPTWLKKKPEVTLDLVLMAGVFAVTEKKNVGMFGSYVIGAKAGDGTFVDVGDVAGVDKVRDQQIQADIMGEGLITGQRVERTSASGTRPGIELRPHIVVTIRFEGLLKDPGTGDVKLRGPKLVAIRSDKSPYEANTMKDLEELYLRQRVG